MAEEVFEQVLRGTDLQLLYPMLEQLEQLGFNADEEVFYNERLRLPLYHVLSVINYNSDEYGRFSNYIGQVLLFIASKTTPTKAIIERFERSSTTSFHALDDLLKRYDGEKIRFSFTHPAYMDMLLGYSVVDLESPVQYCLYRGKRERGFDRQEVDVLPIEVVILQFAKYKYMNEEKANRELAKYYDGPRPRLEHLLSIIENGEDLYSFMHGVVEKEWTSEKVIELVEKVK